MSESAWQAAQPGVTGEPPKEKKSRRRGCLLMALGLLAFTLLGFVLLGVVVIKLGMDKIEDYTSHEPLALPAVEMPETARQGLTARVDAFLADIEEGRPSRIELTGPEINILIQIYEPFGLSGLQTYVELDDTLVVTRVSLPVTSLFEGSPITWLGIQEQYLNGTVTLEVSMENGALQLRAKDVALEGQQLSPEVVAELSKQNLGEELRQTRLRKWIDMLDTVRVQNSSMVLEGRSPGNSGTRSEDPAMLEAPPAPAVPPIPPALPPDSPL